MFAALILIMCLTKIDRVVTSSGGKLVSAERVNVFQSLDPSIIKSIDVREGDEVQKGQVLATLDPTFSAADVRQLKQQVATLKGQIARDEAQLNNRPLVLPEETDPDMQKSLAVQKDFYNQQVAQYKAQLRSFDAKIEPDAGDHREVSGGRCALSAARADRQADRRHAHDPGCARHGLAAQFADLAGSAARIAAHVSNRTTTASSRLSTLWRR